MDNERQESDLLKLVVCVQQLGTSVKILEYSNENGNECTASGATGKIELKKAGQQVQWTNKHSISNLSDSLIFNDKKLDFFFFWIRVGLVFYRINGIRFLTGLSIHLNKVEQLDLWLSKQWSLFLRRKTKLSTPTWSRQQIWVI